MVTPPTLAVIIMFPTDAQLSETVGIPNETIVVQFPAPSLLLFAVAVAGQMIVGGVISFNVIVKVVDSVFPLPSSAVMVISWVVLCPLITVPETGDCVLIILPAAVQLSDAVVNPV